MDHAEALMSATFAALAAPNTRYLADEHGVEPVEYIREDDDKTVVRWLGREYRVESSRLFVNPEIARVCHETLRSNAEARVHEPIERDE